MQARIPIYSNEFRHNLDDKGRITIPSEWRYGHAPEDVFLAAPHPDGYIAVLPPPEVVKLREKISAIASSNSRGQAFAARYFAKTQSFVVDKAGRVGLQAPLLQHAGIDKNAVLVGLLTKFHIYSPARWQQEQEVSVPEIEVMRELGL